MGYQIINPTVSKQDDILYVSMTLRYIDDVTNEVIREINFSDCINWNRADAQDLLLQKLKEKAKQAKAEIDEYLKIKNVLQSMVDEIKKDLGV
ncbi:MAG TPA: hypothetical protein ENG63_04955 [Candidatus Desulfofervidus auxilii]|uniref:Uncharacterized protein n=1 Tax=Desulfofervidus auxilii TaxID=1621989 RepID=A0A7C0Y9Y4_DESA2|nr:hypothetical protein [Candidatus Desulfofervidus auxilii]